MKELSLQEIKEIEFDILKMFDVFCKENNIRYYLAYGTLLGAIRYKKFIPWDDDVDVLVPREDYDRLLTIFQDSDKYHLYAFERSQDFAFPFAKLCDLTTRKDEPGYDNGLKLGLDIDIFPLDFWDNDLEKAKQEAKCIGRSMAGLGFSKLSKLPSKPPAKRVAIGMIMVLCKLLGRKYFIRQILKESVKEEQKDSAYIGAKTWCVYGERGIIPAEAFADTIEVEFEGQMFPAPAGYDTYLTCLYGDYLPEPPKEKQKTHHVFKAYRL